MESVTESEESQKNAGYYTALVEAWIGTRMEKDRSLLTLSTAGFGLLITLLTTVGPGSIIDMFLYGFAGLFFITSMICAIRVFDQNADHLKDVINGKTLGDDPHLVRVDKLMFRSFILGVLFTASVAVVTGCRHLELSYTPHGVGSNMAEKTAIQKPTEKKSLTGIGAISPGRQSAGNNNASGNPGSGSAKQDAKQQTGGGKSGS